MAGPSLSNEDQTRNACPTVGRIEARHPEELPAVSASETNRNGERGDQCSLLKAVWMGKSVGHQGYRETGNYPRPGFPSGQTTWPRMVEKWKSGASLEVQWLRLCASAAGATGLIPGQEIKIPHASWHSQKKSGIPFIDLYCRMKPSFTAFYLSV